MPAHATPEQVAYVLRLLAERGFSTRYMDSSFKRLGATMRERSGSVEEWVSRLGVHGASQLIERLLAIPPRDVEGSIEE